MISQKANEAYYRIITLMPASIEKCTKALNRVEEMYEAARGNFEKINLAKFSYYLKLLNKSLGFPLRSSKLTKSPLDIRKVQSWNSFKDCLSMILIDMMTALKGRVLDLKLAVENDFCKLFTPNSISSLKAYPDILVFINRIQCMTCRLHVVAQQHLNLNSSFLVFEIRQRLSLDETDFLESQSASEFLKELYVERSCSCNATIKKALALQRKFIDSCQKYALDQVSNPYEYECIDVAKTKVPKIPSPPEDYFVHLNDLIAPIYFHHDFANFTGESFANKYMEDQLITTLSSNGLGLVKEYECYFRNVIEEYVSRIPFIKKRQKEARDSFDKIASFCLDVFGKFELDTIVFMYTYDQLNDILRSAYKFFNKFSNAQLDTMEEVIKRYTNNVALELRKVIWSLLTLRGIKDKTLWIFLLDAKKLTEMVLRTIFIPDGFDADDVRANVYKEIAQTFATEKYDLVTEWKKRPHNVLFFLGHVFNDLEFLKKLTDIDVAPLMKSIYIHFVPYLEELLENSPAPMYHMIPFEFINFVYELLEKMEHLRPLREKLEKHCLFHLPQHILDNRSLLLRRFILPRTNTNMLRNWLVLREDYIPINDRIAIKKLFDSIDILEQGYTFFFQKETLKCVVDLFFIEYNDKFNYYVSFDGEVEIWAKLIWKIGEYIRSREDDYMTPELNLNSLGDPDLYEGQSRHVKQVEELLMSLVESPFRLLSNITLKAMNVQFFDRPLYAFHLALIMLRFLKRSREIENPFVQEINVNFTKSIVKLEGYNCYYNDLLYDPQFVEIVLELCVKCRKGMTDEREELVPLVEIFQGPFFKLSVGIQRYLIPYLKNVIRVILPTRIYVNMTEKTIRLLKLASLTFLESIKLLDDTTKQIVYYNNDHLIMMSQIANQIIATFETIKKANPSTGDHFMTVTLSERDEKALQKSLEQGIHGIRNKLRSLEFKLNQNCVIS